jgi:hypothetical protein
VKCSACTRTPSTPSSCKTIDTCSTIPRTADEIPATVRRKTWRRPRPAARRPAVVELRPPGSRLMTKCSDRRST